eukprot:479951_1
MSDDDQEMKFTNNDTITEQFNQHQFETNIKQCRDALSQNPNDYNTHLNLVNALSNIKYINQFRKARDKMTTKFAIPPSVSINFINIEMEYLYYLSKNTTPTIEQINIIINHFKIAIKDYCVDIKLWINYLQFVFQFKSIIGINEIRNNIINEAIKTIGQHFHDSHTFWALYRQFESENLAMLVNKQNKDDTPDIEDINDINSDSDHDMDTANVSVSKQTEYIGNIWRQQINIAHFQIEDTYRNYQEWECALYGQSSNKYKDKYNKDIFGALAWNGVVSRWKEFMNFLNDIYSSNNNTDEEKKNDNNNSDGYILKSARDALYHFGNSLGRVISYRALALTASEFDSIKQLNEIVPTGQLRASLKEMQYIVDTHGVTKITVARLYISKLSQWIGLDPSLSLHDDCETALCISQTYMNEKNKKYVYLFEMDVPKVMSIGFKVVDVQNKAYLVDQTFADRKNRKKGKQSDRWFGHNGVWFDAYDERCERQLLYSIPFFKERCREITVFKTRKTLLKRIEPFKVKQQQLKDASEQEMKNENE